MILVLSYQKYEQGTDPVVDWLVHYDAPFVRLDLLSVLDGRTSLSFTDDGRAIVNGYDLEARIQVVFYRRFLRTVPLGNCRDILHHHRQLRDDLDREAADLFYEIFHRLRGAAWLPDLPATEAADNKLRMARLARAAGLRVPTTMICNRKEDLQAFHQTQPSGLVCKPINYCGYYFAGNHVYTAYTQLVDETFIQEAPERFFPTLFQARIERDYELRIFYLDGEFYPTVIYANNYGEDLTDVKLISNKDTTHNLPYQLPEALYRALDRFMRSAKLRTGSIDVLRDGAGNYHFIEVNPVGQYTAPGKQCNYHIEKKIAQWLIKNLRPETFPPLSRRNSYETCPLPTATCGASAEAITPSLQTANALALPNGTVVSSM